MSDPLSPAHEELPIVAVTGASGLIGNALLTYLPKFDIRPIRLSRRTDTYSQDLQWNPERPVQFPRNTKLDGVVHLAGESIFGRWTTEKMKRIRSSRVTGTENLCRSLLSLSHQPKVLVCASAIGFYGDRGELECFEITERGGGFLAEVVEEWEAACNIAREANIRVVSLRFGIILSKRGGALAQMLPAFKLGLGGRLGSGNQFMSWIALEDALAAVAFALSNDLLRGPVNCVAPYPVTNSEFTHTLGRLLHRPAVIPVPRVALKLIFGALADEALLSSTRAVPAVLLENGFVFQQPVLEGALKCELNPAPIKS